MPRLSIVIPVVGDPSLLDDTLVSVLENRPADCEILVVHTQPYNDPYELAGEVRFLKAPRRAGFAECLNWALASARSPVVNVVSCGVEVCAGWADAALKRFRRPEIAALAAVIVDRNDPARVVSSGLWYGDEGAAQRIGGGRTVAEIAVEQAGFCAPDALAAFYRASAVREMGGCPAWSDEVSACVDAALALRREGFRVGIEPRSLARINPAAARVRTSYRRGRDSEQLFWRWAWHRGLARSLVAHAALVAGESALAFGRPSMFAQLAGRMTGAMLAAVARRKSHAPWDSAAAEPPSTLAPPHFDMGRFCEEPRAA